MSLGYIRVNNRAQIGETLLSNLGKVLGFLVLGMGHREQGSSFNLDTTL